MKSDIDRRVFLAGSGAVLGGTFALGAPARSDSTGSIAATTTGKIRGIYQDKINAFKGVPYGASTGGSGPVHASVKTSTLDLRPRHARTWPPGCPKSRPA